MPDILNIDEIAQGFPGLSSVSGQHLAEGCVVCLHRHGHQQNILMEVQGDTNLQYELQWSDIFNEQLDNTWQDQNYATEHGACCIAILVALKLTGYRVLKRSIRGTGIDYWLGDGNGILFQNKARLEISGIFRGDQDDIKKRYKIKITQTNQSNNTQLPAYIAVIEFSNPVANFMLKP